MCSIEGWMYHLSVCGTNYSQDNNSSILFFLFPPNTYNSPFGIILGDILHSDCYFFKILFFKSSLRLTAKLRGWLRFRTYLLSLHIHSFPHYQIPHQSGTFVEIDEPLIYHNHPKFPWESTQCCTSHGFY